MSPAALRCASCGAPLAEGAKVCGFCGCSPLPDALGLGLLSASDVQLQRLFEAARKKAEANPDDPAAHCSLGVCYLKRGRAEEAIAELGKAVELAPKAPGVLYLLAFALASGRSWENPEAAQLCQRALAVKPDFKEARGFLHIARGLELMAADFPKDTDVEAALEEYRQALALNVPEQLPYLYAFSGEAFDEAEDAENAVKMYREACSLGAGDSKVCVRLGVLLEESGRLQEARDVLSGAADRDPNNEALAQKLASVQAKLAGA